MADPNRMMVTMSDHMAMFGAVAPYTPASSFDTIGELYKPQAGKSYDAVARDMQGRGYSEAQTSFLAMLSIAQARDVKWSKEQERLMEEGDFDTEI